MRLKSTIQSGLKTAVRIGASRSGKSTVANLMLGCPGRDGPMGTVMRTTGTTTTKMQRAYMDGQANGVVDTPGYRDSSGMDEVYEKDTTAFLRKIEASHKVVLVAAYNENSTSIYVPDVEKYSKLLACGMENMLVIVTSKMA